MRLPLFPSVLIVAFVSLVAIGGVHGAAQPPYDTPPAAEPPYFRVRYEASTQAGELPYAVSYTVWLPPGVKTVRGVIVHQHGCGEGSCKSGQTGAYDLHWQALARKHGCALLSPSYEQPEKANCSLWCDPRNGSQKKFQQGLDDLAKLTGHPELGKVPWALWGHSGGGVWVGSMTLLQPERVAAVWLRSGTPRLTAQQPVPLPPLPVPAAALGVPMMCNLGTKEGVTDTTGRFAGVWNGSKGFFHNIRAQGGLIGVAVDPKSSHDCGNSRYLAIPWFDACLTARLPDEAGGTQLKAMPVKEAHLATLRSTVAIAASDFKEDPKIAIWLPDARLAKAWEEYSRDGEVTDGTAPESPTEVRVTANGEITWRAEADLESGIGAFIIQRDGVEIGRVPQKPVGNIGRQIFQQNGYSDSPTPPLAAMRFVDPEFQAGSAAQYRIITVNSAGKASAPASGSAAR